MNQYVNNDQFSLFFRLISGTSIKSGIKEIKGFKSGKADSGPVFTYNGYADFNAFQNDLKSSYHLFNSELEKNSIAFGVKGEYIFYLKNKQRLIDDTLDDVFEFNSDESIRPRHVIMDFENYKRKVPDAKKDINNYQSFFHAQYKYGKRASILLKDFIQTLIQLTSADIPLKSIAAIQADIATPERPVAFFHEFFLKDGLERFKKSFEPTEEDYLYTNVSFNAVDETKTTHEQNHETGEYEPYIEYFTKDLLKRVKNEYWKFVEAIEAKIDSDLKSKDEISNYLIIQIAKVKELKEGVDTNKSAQKYEISNKVPVKLMKHLVDRYKHYIPVEILRDVSDIYKSEYTTPSQKLTLNISAKEFAQLFGNLIKDQKMQLNGISDVQPIADTLATFFNIPKFKGKGLVLASTLGTEFKKFMAPPTRAHSRK